MRSGRHVLQGMTEELPIVPHSWRQNQDQATMTCNYFRWSRLVLITVICLTPWWPGSARIHVVSAFCQRSRTALGTHPHLGTCAGPRRLLGRYVRIGGVRYRVEDTCTRGFDIWLPTRRACARFGRKRLSVVVGGNYRKQGRVRRR